MTDTMTMLDDLLLWVGALAAAFVAIAAAVVVLKKWLLGDIHADLDDMRSQLHKNHGTSLRDAVDRIEQKQVEQAASTRRLHHRLDEHIAFHLERTDP